MLNVSLESIKGLWQKASQLLSDPSSISSAPGYSAECRMVASHSGKRPHLVTKITSGKFSCDKECPNWKSIGVCSHCIAVAHVNGKLQEFCESVEKSKRSPNVTHLLLTGLPSGTGNKGNQTTRKRKREEVSARVPLHKSFGPVSQPYNTPPVSTSVSTQPTLSPASYWNSPPGPSFSSPAVHASDPVPQPYSTPPESTSLSTQPAFSYWNIPPGPSFSLPAVHASGPVSQPYGTPPESTSLSTQPTPSPASSYLNSPLEHCFPYHLQVNHVCSSWIWILVMYMWVHKRGHRFLDSFTALTASSTWFHA